MSENADTKTLDQCVEEVLKNKKLESLFRLWKFRFKSGTLSEKTKEKIASEAGYVLVQEAKYQLKSK